jgi:hypothetical protein
MKSPSNRFGDRMTIPNYWIMNNNFPVGWGIIGPNGQSVNEIGQGQTGRTREPGFGAIRLVLQLGARTICVRLHSESFILAQRRQGNYSSMFDK